MSYFRKSSHGQPMLEGFGGLEMTSAGFPADANAVPICPSSAEGGGAQWCRKDIFSKAEKVAPSTISQVGTGIAAVLNALAPKPATPVAPVIIQQPGMSTTTKLALAGGAALLLVVLATR